MKVPHSLANLLASILVFTEALCSSEKHAPQHFGSVRHLTNV